MIEESEEVYDFLEHHGIKGQRWGIRRIDRANRAKTNSDNMQKIAKQRPTRLNNFAAKRIKSKSERLAKPHSNFKFKRNLILATTAGAAAGLLVESILNKKGLLPFAQVNVHKSVLTNPKTAHIFTPQFMQTKFSAIPMGPVGSTGIARLRGGIPLPKVGG